MTELVWFHQVAQLESQIEESRAINDELEKQCDSLEENLEKVEAEKMVGGLCIWLTSLLLIKDRFVITNL